MLVGTRHLVVPIYSKRNVVLNKLTCTTYKKAIYFINEYYIEPPRTLIMILIRSGIDEIKFRHRPIDVCNAALLCARIGLIRLVLLSF